jgi:transcriptional regulator with XRE-family HTH domain
MKTSRRPNRAVPLKRETKNEELGLRVRMLRQKYGVTVAQMADKMSIDRSQLCRIEAGGVKDPRLSMLWDMADALNVTIDGLVGRNAKWRRRIR